MNTHTEPATSAQIVELIGEADPIVVERIVELGASFDELAEALADVTEERRTGQMPEPRTAHVAEARELLLPLLDSDDDDDPAPLHFTPATAPE